MFAIRIRHHLLAIEDGDGFSVQEDSTVGNKLIEATLEGELLDGKRVGYLLTGFCQGEGVGVPLPGLCQ